MPETIKGFFKNFTKTQLYLISANILLVFFLIIFSNLGVLPIKNSGDFIFFAVLTLALALYRPGWAFLFFVGTIVLENINLAPESLGISIRPYQFFGALTILAVLIRWIVKRLNFEIIKLKWFDGLFILTSVASVISSFGANDKTASFKLAVIFSSFVFLYLLIRNYIRDIEDLKKVIPIFLASSTIAVLYGIEQNTWFMRGLSSFETMPGRPNSTFAEADWFGIFLVFLSAATYAFIYFKQSTYGDVEGKKRWKEFFFPYVFLTLIFIALVISVSRSAWVGAFFETIIFLTILLTGLTFKIKNWHWRIFFVTSIRVAASLVLALAVIYFFHLTNFQLFNRAESAGSGLQKITIACAPGSVAPEKIRTVGELEKFGCRHIDLEDIGKETTEGNVTSEIYRNDPNVNIRKEIYRVAWQEIKRHPILGIGWGSIGNILGQDERGAGLNSSNIFLEIWLGSGILGFLAFLAVWVCIPLRSALNFSRTINSEEKAVAIFSITAWLGLTVANLFNAGIMLGFLWLFLAIAQIDFQSNENRN